MALNPHFVRLVTQRLSLVGTTLFNMGQIHAAMMSADEELSKEKTVIDFTPAPSSAGHPIEGDPAPERAQATEASSGLAPTEITTALDELGGGAEKSPEELESQTSAEAEQAEPKMPAEDPVITQDPAPAGRTRGGFGRGRGRG